MMTIFVNSIAVQSILLIQMLALISLPCRIVQIIPPILSSIRYMFTDKNGCYYPTIVNMRYRVIYEITNNMSR